MEGGGMDHELYEGMYAADAPANQLQNEVVSPTPTGADDTAGPSETPAAPASTAAPGDTTASQPAEDTVHVGRGSGPDVSGRPDGPSASDPSASIAASPEATQPADGREATLNSGPADDQALSATDCVAALLSVLGLPAGGSTADVVKAARAVMVEVQQLKDLLQKQKRENLALHIQVANSASDALEMRQQMFERECAAEPAIVQLKTLLCDPAVVREFEALKEDALRLQKELQVAKDHLQTVNFNAEAKKGRLLMTKLRSFQRENELLGSKLKNAVKMENQVAIVGEFAENMRNAYACLEGHVAALDAEAEDLTAHIASLQKMTPYHHKVFQMPGRKQFEGSYPDRMRDMMDRPPHLRPGYARPEGRRFVAQSSEQQPPPLGRAFMDRGDRGGRGPPHEARPYRDKRPYDGPPGPYSNQRGDGGYGNREGHRAYSRDIRRKFN